MVGTLAGSGAVSLGLETEASELAFPVISELVGGGSNWSVWWVSCRSGLPECLKDLSPGLYRQGLPHP